MEHKSILFLTLVSLTLPLLIAGGDEVEEELLALDCQDHKANGESSDGEYDIHPYPGDEEATSQNRKRRKVYCVGMQPGSEGAWTVIQRHRAADDPYYFTNKTWALYRDGFGYRSQDFWVGNDALYALTRGRKYTLRVEIDTWASKGDSGLHRHADYADFSVGSEAEKYKLHVGNYSGDAGDAMTYHNGMKFSTVDQDNDIWSRQCTKMVGGGWWFKNCAHCNLNGQAYQGKWTGDVPYWGGVWWLPMHPTENSYEFYFKYSVKSLMKIRRVEDYVPRGIIA